MLQVLRQHIEQLISLTDDEFEVVAAHFQEKRIKKHRFLVQEGEAVSCEFFVVQGLVKTFHSDANGKEHIVAFAKEEWWVSDYQAYHTQSAATLNVDCLEDTDVLCLSYTDREHLLSKVKKMESFFLKKSNYGYIALQRRILGLLSSSAKERYEQFLQQYPGLVSRIPKTVIAAYLGVSRETLSRLS
ncbi:cyclic nucleotide-binding domain-containing protein [Flavobacterium sp. Sd200]|uniref:Crp/Fnr family transcriptional regulator n=1 Tax=Flavobacterium sp. Sd200 TaxID=2692211 RepID=UPI0013715C57|nr:Crp/Fnr family transcriptional regulator [Flavobacterium sp. Sd200]MXN92077.1 cyclic nucleotide-binding domain-containing protein [Flavobacterium sp. Sd200]